MTAAPTLSKFLPNTTLTKSPWVMRLAIGLLALDALLMGLYMGYYAVRFLGGDSAVANFLLWEGWSGDLDHSVLEFVGYVKMLAASGLAVVLARRTGQRVYLAWGTVFLLIALDDALMLHERTGSLLHGTTGRWSMGGLSSGEIGELLFWLVSGLVLGGWLLKTYAAASPPARRDSIPLFAGTAVIVVFAMGVDLVHGAVGSDLSHVGTGLFNFFEATGEVLGMTFLAVVCAALVTHRGTRSGTSAG